MCDYTLVIIKEDGEEEKIMESVEEVIKEDNTYIAKNIFGEKVVINGIFEKFDGSNNLLKFRVNK